MFDKYQTILGILCPRTLEVDLRIFLQIIQKFSPGISKRMRLIFNCDTISGDLVDQKCSKNEVQIFSSSRRNFSLDENYEYFLNSWNIFTFWASGRHVNSGFEECFENHLRIQKIPKTVNLKSQRWFATLTIFTLLCSFRNSHQNWQKKIKIAQ